MSVAPNFALLGKNEKSKNGG